MKVLPVEDVYGSLEDNFRKNARLYEQRVMDAQTNAERSKYAKTFKKKKAARKQAKASRRRNRS